MIKDYRELPAVPKIEARAQQEDAMARFLAKGGMVEQLKGRKNPKGQTANGKNKGGGKIMHDPTARFPKKD
jgi:hypothetical protein